MKVVLGSTNEPKRQAVLKAFEDMFPDDEIIVELINASSGVSSHPTSGSESLKGAKNRSKHAKELHPGGDYYVGIEGGLTEIDSTAWEIGYVVIEDSKGEIHTGLSSGIEMQGKLLNAIRAGKELSLALEDTFGLKDIGKANGFYGLTTDDHVTRADALHQAIIFALAPFKHPEYFT